MEHELYTAEDFKHLTAEEMDEDITYRMVMEGGLAVCKHCGEFEAGLDYLCHQQVNGFEIYENRPHRDYASDKRFIVFHPIYDGTEVHATDSYSDAILYCQLNDVEKMREGLL